MKKFDIPSFYRSSIIGEIKEGRRVKDRLKKDFSPTKLDFTNSSILLARHFGFCYGVENAVEIAYKTLDEFPDKRIFFLSEMIHNPDVNKDLLERGVSFILDTYGKQLIPWEKINEDDIVVVPAFGTTLETENILKEKGIDPYKFNTTCPFVEKVWTRASQIGQRGYTVVVHGKPKHEETRATFSHSKAHTPTLVIKDLKEAKILEGYLKKEKKAEDFFLEFKGRYSEGFDPNIHLEKIGVVNQTTMLAEETQEISDYLKSVLVEHYNLDASNEEIRFANTRDTLCYATNDNQQATKALLETPADLAIVVGGYNSSNTQHLVELCQEKLPTYFIKSSDNILNSELIQHYDLNKKAEILSTNYLPKNKKPTILLTCGASCPDSVMEAVLVQLIEQLGSTNEMETILAAL